MHKHRAQAGIAAVILTLTGCAMQTTAPTPSGPMSFFITSAGSGKGADLGGLAGADAHCQRLAGAAGAGGKTWRAYLSVPPTFPSGSNPAVAAINARDRIGNGPWFNAKGELVARDLAQLHSNNNLSKTSALDEKGQVRAAHVGIPGMTKLASPLDITEDPATGCLYVSEYGLQKITLLRPQ